VTAIRARLDWAQPDSTSTTWGSRRSTHVTSSTFVQFSRSSCSRSRLRL